MPNASYHFKSFNTLTDFSHYNNTSVYTPTGCGDTTKKTTCTFPIQLNADAGAPYWTWSTGEKTSSISVSTAGLYWWETGDMSQNKVVNGDFTSGKSGFISDYGYLTPNGSGTLYPEGKYTITTNPHSVHDGYDSFADHTGSSSNPRNMMVINGDTVKDKIVWSENITVTPNTNYIFSIWCASANSGNPAQLSFTIGTITYPLFALSSTTGLWQNFTIPTSWNSGSSTSVKISIINKNTIASGNDFALDDIVFAPVCRKYFNVVYDPTPSTPTITPR
ncbi:hypothetical protein [Mucilaginibacter jinjuensis]|uniref:CBM-cenC domain-containing protein n=1 Tax=Mucilaginibacter jinjuensis TaxID=1176721 RepID=A0ABY7T1H9_9SPHI|nr:hypothetical protein [Mucilaginibacter jinjuensis]WCT10030.1 hypothetical protein PQO05_14955 [Mucilaginibacter jinjuensis]